MVPFKLPESLVSLNDELSMSDVTILLTGAGGTAAKNFVAGLRLLGKNSPRIVGIDLNKYNLLTADIEFREIVPKVTESEYGDIVRSIYSRYKCDLLHSQPDLEVAFWGEDVNNREINTCFPSERILKICQNKYNTFKIFKEAGVPAPDSYLVNRYDEILDFHNELISRSGQNRTWIRAACGAGSKAALPIYSYTQAKEWIQYWKSTNRLDTDDFVLSEYLPGKEYAFQSLWVRGELIMSQARERVESLFGNLFPSGQSSSPAVARTVCNALVNKVATEAVTALALNGNKEEITGVFCVDMKERADGIPCVTEINAGRFFTTSNFFSIMGVNMPAYYIAHAVGKIDLENYDLPKYDILPPDYYWIRDMDNLPLLVHGSELTQIKDK